MAGLMAFIFLVSIICIIIGLVKPSIVIRWGSDNHKTRGRAALIYGLIAIVSLALFSAAPHTAATVAQAPSSAQAPKTTKTTYAKSTSDNLVASDVGFEQEGYAGYITGTVKNNTNHAYRYVEVNINVYDESGAQIASPLANTQNLQAGGTWRFKAPIVPRPQSKFTYKVIKVVGRT